MIATEILREEHRIILSVLHALEKICDAGRVDKNVGEKVIVFIRQFADGCHHGKEEARLFKWMRSHHLGNGPVGLLEEEHETGRGFVRAMNRALEEGNENMYCESARGLIGMLRLHIQREDHGVFVMADDVALAHEDKSLIAEFADVEQEAGGHRHDDGLVLAQEICDAAGVSCVTLGDLPNLARLYMNVEA